MRHLPQRLQADTRLKADKSNPTAAEDGLVLLCSYHSDNRPDGPISLSLSWERCLGRGQHSALFNPEMSFSIHIRHPYTGNLNSENAWGQ